MDEFRPYCRAHSKRTGKPCRNRILPGEKVCRMHGRDGGAPLIHGKDSALPIRIRDAKLAAANDPRLLDLADGVALLDSLMQSRMQMLDAGDAVGWRIELSRKLQQWREADPDAQGMLHHELESMIENGARAGQAEDELFEMRDRISERVEAIQKIRLAKGSAVNARDLARMKVMELHELKRLFDREQVPIPAQQRIVAALIDFAERFGDAPAEFRSELGGAALEVAGGRV